jgi:ubiquinone/menaquinone biosynthesis C-methylase UbiE
MPDLSTQLHNQMLRQSKRANAFHRRLLRAVRDAVREPWIYGNDWAVIRNVPPLRHVLEHWVLPYVKPDQVALEIGAGGGRWTRHMLGFRKLYLVDYYPEVMAETKRSLGNRGNLEFVLNNGSDFPGIADSSIDFCFSFGTFVHLDPPIIESYLDNLRRVMKPGANIVIQYSDKTKVLAQKNEGFSDNTPEKMRLAIESRGYRILEEDTTSLWHSSLVRFAI